MLYYLDGKIPVKAKDTIEWFNKLKHEDKQIAFDTIGEIEISTVFLGVDMNIMGNIPILFETMIFGFDEEYIYRYSTYEEAQKGHLSAIKFVKIKLENND